MVNARPALAGLALLFNAFAWGVSWWPFRQLQALGVHPLWATALIYWVALVWLAALRPVAWRGFKQHPGLWILLLAAGLTNIGFNWAVTVGDVVRVVLLFYLMPAWVVLLAWPIGWHATRPGQPGAATRPAVARLDRWPEPVFPGGQCLLAIRGRPAQRQCHVDHHVVRSGVCQRLGGDAGCWHPECACRAGCEPDSAGVAAGDRIV